MAGRQLKVYMAFYIQQFCVVGFTHTIYTMYHAVTKQTKMHTLLIFPISASANWVSSCFASNLYELSIQTGCLQRF